MTNPAFERFIQQGDQALAHGQIAKAKLAAQNALRMAPNHPAALDLMRAALVSQRQLPEALDFAQRAVATDPDNPHLLYGLAQALSALGRKNDAEPLIRRVLQLAPEQLDTHMAAVDFFADQGRAFDAIDVCRNALTIFPDHPKLIGALGAQFSEVGRDDQASAIFADGVFKHPGDLDLAWALCCQSNLTYPVNRERVLARHRNIGRVIELLEHFPRHTHTPPAPVPPGAAGAPGAPTRPIRVGLMSSDLRDHSVAFFLPALLRHLDRARFELWVYSLNENPDWMTHNLKRAMNEGDNDPARAHATPTRWRPLPAINQLSGEELAKRIVSDRIDILIELNALSAGNRVDALKLKPAPIIVTYLGYPNGTGLAAVDYRIVDHLTDPPVPGADEGFIERLVRLDPCFLCYDPPREAPPVSPLPALANGFVTFASFNRFVKVNDAVIETWARVLQAVPRSVLMLKSLVLGDSRTIADVRARFAAHAIDPERIRLVARTSDRSGHLGAYNHVDIALDTFAYAGTTTTCEALHMGVPVVTLAEHPPAGIHAMRVGASLLTNVGLPELIAPTRDDYVRIAAQLAADLPRLGALRQSLRQRLADSALCDAPAFAKAMGELLQRLWTSYSRAQNPTTTPATSSANRSTP
jgi:protein O-GlcNAc transferase